MGKKTALVLLVALLLLSSIVFSLTVSGANYANLCQCETAKQKISVCSDAPGIYSISSTSVQGKWFSFAPAVIDLTSKRCEDVFVFITPDCYALAGDYKVPLSISGPESIVKDYDLVVRQCHKADLNIIQTSLLASPCSNAKTRFVLKNTGSFGDEFVLVQKGLADNWATYPQEKIVLAPFSSFEGELSVTPFCNAEAKNYSFELSAINTKTNFSVSKSLSLSVPDTAPFSVGKLFGESKSYKKTLCEESDFEEYFEVSSVSMRSDKVMLSLLDSNKAPLLDEVAQFDKNFVLIDKNKSEGVSLLIKRSAGTKTGFIRAYSFEYDKNFDIPFEFVFENCFDASIERKSSEVSQCFSNRSEDFIVKNTGTKQSTVSVEFFIDGRSAGTKELVLLKGESKSVSFLVYPSVSKKSLFEARIFSQYFSKDINYDFEFENCFDLSADVSNIGTCPSLTIDYVFDVKNNGTKPQTVTLSINAPWLDVSPGPFEIDANATKSVSLKGTVPSNFENAYEIKIKSSQQELLQSFNVSDLGSEACHSFSAVLSKNEIDSNCCSGKLVDLNVTNTGFFSSGYSIKSIYPSWVYLSEDSFSLDPKESRRVFVYASPDANANGVIDAEIAVLNDFNVSKSLALRINVKNSSGFIDSNDVIVKISAVDVNYSSGLTELEFVLLNKSMSGFTLNGVSLITDSNAFLIIDKNAYIAPDSNITGALFVPIDLNSSKNEADAIFMISTSAGVFKKAESFSLLPSSKGLTMTAFFSAYSMPFVEVLLVLLLVLVLLALRSRLSKSKKGGEKPPSTILADTPDESLKNDSIVASPKPKKGSLKKKERKAVQKAGLPSDAS